MVGEGDLVLAARGGDRRALESLLIAHYVQVHAVCRRMTGNEADAQDAAQDTMLSASRGITRFDGRSAFGTWLYRIATNVCLDELRRRRRRPEPSPLDDRAGRGSTDVRSRTDPFGSVMAKVDVDAALMRLPIEFRAAVVLRDLCDLGYEDIAEVLGVPVGTVRSRIARGRGMIADQLGDTGEPGGGGNSGGRPGVEPDVGRDSAT